MQWFGFKGSLIAGARLGSDTWLRVYINSQVRKVTKEVLRPERFKGQNLVSGYWGSLTMRCEEVWVRKGMRGVKTEVDQRDPGVSTLRTCDRKS